MARLTLTVDDELASRAVDFAARHNTTVEKVLESYLNVITRPPLKKEDLPPLTRSLYGIAPPMTDAEVDELLDQRRVAKYQRP